MPVRGASRAEVAAAWATPRAALPFAVLAVAGIAILGLPPYQPFAWHLVAAVVLLGVLLAGQWIALNRSERSWLDVVAPLGAFPFIVILRDAAGGEQSGLAPLVALPVFWLALYGRRRDLMVAAVLAGLTFWLPLVVVGGEAYPPGEWRRGLLWAGIALVIAPVVQGLVQRLGVETARSRANATRVEGIMRGATLSSLITTDPAGRVLTFSTGAEQELGYRAPDVVGHELTSMLLEPRELREAADQLGVATPDFAVLARLAHQRATSRIWSLRRADGHRAFARMAVTELRDDDGRVSGYLCVAIDATASIRSQRALGQAEERWRILMDHLPDATVVMIEEGTGITVVTGAGPLARQLRDAAGRRLTEIIDTGAAGTLARMLEQAFAGREVPAVYALVGDLEHEFVASPLPSTTERRQAIVMARDVSRERERERSLTAAKERAERLFVDAPQGIALLDLDGVVEQANPTLTTLLGAGELVGRKLSTLSFHPDDTTVDTHLERVRLTDGHRAETQWSVRGAGSDEVHVALISTMLPGEGGSGDRILTNVVDVSERYRYERQLAFLAEHDALTGLANRRRFDQLLDRHVEECRRYGPRGAVLMLDLDRFKEVNDSLGHAAGDRLLVDMARVLDQRMRSTDLVARLGGDEFAILLPYADRKAAELVAADVVDRIRAEVSGFDDLRRHVTVSVGGVAVDRQHTSGTELLSAADAAMYVAKNSGRDRYTFLSVSHD